MPRGGLGFVGEDQKAGQHQVGLVGRGDGGQLRRGFDRHGNHPAAGAEQRGQGLLRRLGCGRTPGQHLLGCTLDHQNTFAVVVDQGRRRPPGMVERQTGDPVRGATDDLLSAGVFPQRGVQRIGGATAAGRVDIAGQQAQTQNGIGVRPTGVDGIDQADAALGQGPGLIGDQDVDVAEVFDAHQAFDQDLGLGQPS